MLNILTNIDTNDSFTNRICYMTNGGKFKSKRLIIELAGTLPILYTTDGLVDKYVIRDYPALTISEDIASLDDPNTPNRFIFIGAVQSALNLTNVYMYYDNKYKDIFIIPSIEQLLITSDNTIDKLRGHRLGSGKAFDNYWLSNLIPLDLEYKYDLPTAKANSAMKSMLVTMPGFDPSNMVNTNKFEEQSGVFNIQHGDRKLYTLISLGKASDLFTTVTNIPLYLLYQPSYIAYGLKYVNSIDPADYNLYLGFRF